MTTHPSDLERALALVPKLEGLLEKATAGPWQAMAPDEVDVFVPIIAVNLGEDGQPLHTPTRGLVGGASLYPTEVDAEDYTRAIANAALIVDAVNALPTLLSALRTVEEERWQPIETVDEPLERCLLWCSDVGLDGEPHGVVTGRLSRSWQGGLRPYGAGMTGDWTFTHVRPLPSAPVSSLGEADGR